MKSRDLISQRFVERWIGHCQFGRDVVPGISHECRNIGPALFLQPNPEQLGPFEHLACGQFLLTGRHAHVSWAIA
jgi:hypothetical protein